MNNSILKPQSALKIQSRKQQNILKGLVELVNCSIKKMEKRHIQLTQISENHFDVYIRMQAEEYLVKQTKMISIAYELNARIIESHKLSKINKINKELIQQYIDELDIMNFMDFEVTKKYFSFIHTHFQPRVIQMTTMAA